jgi:hypothetical protein
MVSYLDSFEILECWKVVERCFKKITPDYVKWMNHNTMRGDLYVQESDEYDHLTSVDHGNPSYMMNWYGNNHIRISFEPNKDDIYDESDNVIGIKPVYRMNIAYGHLYQHKLLKTRQHENASLKGLLDLLENVLFDDIVNWAESIKKQNEIEKI